MNAAWPEPQAILAAVLRALAERGQRGVAEAAGLSETRLSRWKSADSAGGGLDLEETARVLASLGLMVMPVDPDGMVTVPASTHAALHVLLRDYADAMIAGKGRTECR